jgi:hypothetical protein
MNRSHSVMRPRLAALATLAVLAGFSSSAWALTTVATVPVGYLKLEFAGSGASTPFGLPLDETPAPGAGMRAGKIESYTTSTLSNSSGGWTVNLASASAPWLLRLTSGAAAGKSLEVVSNTATTLTVAGADLTSLGLTAGTDTFELIPLDTLWTLLGSGTVQGGPSAALADNVSVRSGAAWLAYYYDTNLGFWRRTIGPATNSNNIIVRPGTGLQLLRRNGAITLTFTGRVLAAPFHAPINNSSTSAIQAGYPTDTTLGGLAVQSLLPGWRSGPTATGSDLVALYTGTAWVNYFYNGTFWQPALGGATNSDSQAIPAGAVFMLQRPGATAGTTDLVRPLPYSL